MFAFLPLENLPEIQKQKPLSPPFLGAAPAVNMHTKTTVAAHPDQVRGTSLSKAGAKGD